MEDLRPDSALRHEEDPAFERRESRIASIAWIVLIAAWVGCAAGLFGGGPLSRAHAEAAPDGLRVEYQWIGRYSTNLPLTIYAPPDPDGTTRVTLDRTILDAFHVRQITPEPQSSRLASAGVEYAFAGGAAGATPVLFELEAGRPGLVRGSIRSGTAALGLRQFILP